MNESTSKANIFNTISFYVLLVTVGLLPIFFLPILNLPIELSKNYLLAFGTTIAFILWIIARLIDGTLVLPKNLLLIAGFGILAVSFFAALFSPAPATALWGTALDLGTFSSFLFLFLCLLLSSYFFQDAKKVSYFYIMLFGSFVLISLFQILYLFLGSKFFNLDIFTGSTANLVGGWNDLGIFYGLVVILSLLTLELFSPKSIHRILVYSTLIISLLFLILINFMQVWILVGSFSLIMFIYILSIKRQAVNLNIFTTVKERNFPAASFIIILFCLLFILANNFVGSVLSSHFNITHTDVRPSVTTTIQITKNILATNPVFGTGPNRFDYAWSLFRPAAINNSIFWNTNFSSGFGFLPTLIVTTGLAGFAFILLFLLLLVYQGFSKALRFSSNKNSNYLLLSSFVATAYLLIFSIIYNPGIVIMVLAFVFVGIFIAILSHLVLMPTMYFNFLEDPRHSFFSILAFVILLILTISSTYMFAEKFAAALFFERGVALTNRIETLPAAEAQIQKALQFDDSAVYYRSLTSIYLTELNSVLNNSTLSADNIKSEFKNLFDLAENSARKAVLKNTTDSQNWINLAGVYQTVVPLQIPNAYENAKMAYAKAQALDPQNPQTDLFLARLEITRKDSVAAKKHITDALAKKSNFKDAVFLYAQIEVSEGNTKDAINQLEQLSLISQNDSTVFFQLGLLKYNTKDFTGSISALERAIALDQTYWNAYYFLALSYEKAGNTDTELKIFTFLNKQLPNDPNIKNALDNVTAGKSALSSAQIPQEQTGQPSANEKIPKK